jgi:hypothetical protein
MLLIGFGYKARRGKDTAIRSIIEARGQGKDIRRYAFADALRDEVHAEMRSTSEYFGLTYRGALARLCESAGVPFDTNAPADEQNPHGKQRALLQWWGTEFRRASDPHYWLKRMRERIEADGPYVALISDVRFLNEFEMIRSAGGYMVRVEREGFEVEAPVAQHVSERELDALGDSAWDATIWALDGDMEELRIGAVEVYDSMAARYWGAERR